MAEEYVVRQGDQLSSIAARFGFENFETIWNSDLNEHLRAVRDSPHSLLPGDVVVIPPKELVEFERMTGSSHDFQVHVERLKLRLKLLGFDGKPLASSECVLELGGKEQKLTTDGDGFVEFELPRSERRASLKTPSGVFPLRIGQLDPVSEPTGWEQRLVNLDYLDGPAGVEEPLQVEQGIRRFQAVEELDESGKMDRDTQDKLAEVYGT